MSAQPGRARRASVDGPRVSTNFRPLPEVRARLEAEADRRGVAMGVLVEKAVERYLPVLEAQELWPDVTVVDGAAGPPAD